MVKTWKSSAEALQSAFAGRTFAKPSADGSTQFHVSMKRRLSFRFLQILMAILTWVLLGTQDWTATGAYGLKVALWLFLVCCPFISLFSLGIYYNTPLTSPPKDTRVQLGLEALVDSLTITLFLVLFFVLIAKTSGICPPGTSSGCDKGNVLIALLFFNALVWTTSLGYIVHDYLEFKNGGEVDVNSLRRQLRSGSIAI